MTVEADQCDNLLRVAAALGARAQFIVVGGCALRLHGQEHLPPDLDLVPEPSSSNVRRLFEALAALGVPRQTRPTDHLLASREILSCVTAFGVVDVLLERGREEYAALRTDSVLVNVMSRDVRVASVADVLELRSRFGKVAIDA